MTQAPISAREIKQTEDYLKGYQLCRKMLRLDRYERKFFGYREEVDEMPSEAPGLRATMFGIRHFVMSLDNCDEKLLLYYHYIRGEPVEKCAELLGFSRASAFRLKKKAIAKATEKRLHII